MVHTRSAAGAMLLFALVASGSAQQPQRNDQSQPPRTPEAAVTVQPTTTLVGCLYREDQVPGRKPNVAERAGMLEDYILAGASVSNASAKQDAAPTGTSGAMPMTGNMYKIEKIADDQLKGLVGKRVEVTGRIDAEGGAALPKGAQPDRGLGPDQINLPEIEASSIREIAGSCPAAPAPLQ